MQMVGYITGHHPSSFYLLSLDPSLLAAAVAAGAMDPTWRTRTSGGCPESIARSP